MNHLILTSNFFPGKNEEPFLASEFPYLDKKFESISVHRFENVLSPSKDEDINLLELKHSNIRVRELVRKNISLLIQAFWIEMVRSGTPIFYINNLKRFLNLWIGWLQQAEAWELALKGFNPKETVIYSYWYENQAMPLTILRAQGKLPFYWVSRAHGWDVDKRQRKEAIIPFRHWMLKNPPDQLASISQFGSQIFKKDYATNSIVHRLGTLDMDLAKKNDTAFLKIVAISSLIELKRVDLILSSLQKVNANCFITIYGDGPSRQKLKAMNMPKNIKVIFKGHMAHSKMLHEIQAEGYDLMLHTSKLEGIPVSIMECMSMGIPAMACDTGGVAELVNNENGWLLPVKINSEELADKLDYLALNKEILDAKRISARAKWEKDYQASVNFPRFINEVLLKQKN